MGWSKFLVVTTILGFIIDVIAFIKIIKSSVKIQPVDFPNPSDPSISISIQPIHRIWAEITSVILAYLIFATIWLFILNGSLNALAIISWILFGMIIVWAGIFIRGYFLNIVVLFAVAWMITGIELLVIFSFSFYPDSLTVWLLKIMGIGYLLSIPISFLLLRLFGNDRESSFLFSIIVLPFTFVILDGFFIAYIVSIIEISEAIFI